MPTPIIHRRLAVTAVLISLSLPARADDWPQWLGPTRDGVWQETGVVQTIPDGGLPIVWRVPVKGGYSGPAVVGNRVYLTD
jgi:outer membrane protein assembly factor BamB